MKGRESLHFHRFRRIDAILEPFRGWFSRRRPDHAADRERQRVSAEARESPEMDEPWGNGASFHHMDTRYGGAIGVAFRWLAL